MQKSRKAARSTYAVSLCFDDFSADEIFALEKALAVAVGNDYLVKNAVPPHLTLGMFHVAEGDEAKVREAFEDFAKSVGHSFSLDFGGFDSFLEKVIFLLVKDGSPSFSRVKGLNSKLHEIFFAFKPGGNKNYLPERFLPHVALAVKLSKEQFEKGKNWACPFATLRVGLSAVPLPLHSSAPCGRSGTPSGAALIPHAKIIAVSLAQCHPYKEICRISLSTDSLSPEQRHKNMSAIRSTGGKLEVSLRSELFRFGFRFRKNDKRLVGKPDIVFPHYKAVIFVNGCFWHAHGWKSEESLICSPLLEEDVLYSLKCDKFRMPTTNPEFWLAKFTRNRERDLRDIEKLLAEGWRVGVVWECSITGRLRKEKIRSVAEKISLWLEEGYSEVYREF